MPKRLPAPDAKRLKRREEGPCNYQRIYHDVQGFNFFPLRLYFLSKGDYLDTTNIDVLYREMRWPLSIDLLETTCPSGQVRLKMRIER